MNAPGAPEIERLPARVVRTPWGHAAGYVTVIRAAADGGIETRADHA
ncbi:hypothetical protein ACIQCQ_05865 [Streptomyces sp. NPDC088394]